MNSAEFKTWLDNHVTLIPSVRSWLNKQPAPDRVLEEWQRILSRCSVESCCEASRAILAGEIERPFAEDTPSRVRAWAAERDSDNRVAEVSHNPKFCELCSNTGIVTIYHVLVVRGIREDIRQFVEPRSGNALRALSEDGKPVLPNCGVACKCALGDRFASGRKRVGRNRWEDVERERFGDSRHHVAVAVNYFTDISQK